jgi:cyclopropane fatty-acyl-phospholipid synthase-like methyltransferase
MSVPDNWWKDFFSGLVVEMWRAVQTSEQNSSEAAWIEKQFGVSPPAKLLDVPCGDGRLSLELAARGFQVTGVDLSRDFLAAAHQAAAQRALQARFEERDMRDLPWREEFDGAFTFGNSFGYLGDQGDGEFLAAVGRALKPGARLVMDTKCAEMVFPNFIRAKQHYEFGDISTDMHDHYDPVHARVDTEYIFSRGEKRETKWATERIYTFCEIRTSLESSGFEDVKGYGSMALEPLEIGSKRLFVAATRRR